MTTMNEAIKSFRAQTKLVLRSLSSPFLIWFLVAGNSLMFSIASLFYFVESNHNPQIHHLMDAIWWGFTTVTTVGYGDIVPVTFGGRILGIVLMVIGSTFFVGFTAIFVSSLIAMHTDYLSIKEEEVTMREYRNLLAVMQRIERRIAALENKK